MTAEHLSPEAFAQSMSEKQLHCRELGHNWRPLTATYDPKARVFDRSLRCASCRTIRKQVLSSRGDIVSNRYMYQQGYLAQNLTEHPGIGAMRSTFRLEAVHRFLSNVTTLKNGAA